MTSNSKTVGFYKSAYERAARVRGVTPIEARSPSKIIELLLKIEQLLTCKSKATGTSTSKLGYHLQMKSLTFLSVKNLFADFAKCNKSADRVDSAEAMSSVAMRYAKPRTHAQYVYYF